MNVAVSSIGCAGGQHLDRPQHPQLGLEVEAVAALGLGGGGAERQHLGQAGAPAVDQLVLARRARGGHGLDDAAAGGGDLGIGRAAEASPQLVAAIAAEHQVGMRIDEARHHRAAARVDHLRRPA